MHGTVLQREALKSKSRVGNSNRKRTALSREPREPRISCIQADMWNSTDQIQGIIVSCFEHTYALFYTRSLRVVRAVRKVRAVVVVRAVREVRTVSVVRAVSAVRV